MYCQSCLTALPQSAVFCTHCGSWQITNQQAAAQAVQLPPPSSASSEKTVRMQPQQALFSLTGKVPMGREHPAVERTKEYLQAHYAEEIALQALAKVAHLSPFHLARIFRQAIGVSPHAYQTQLRLAHARTLLAQGFEVGYVAQETGFADQSHFTRQFKRYYLMPPGSYRKTARLF